MIITRERFQEDFLKWVKQKLKALPEEGLENLMFAQAVKSIGDHNGEYLEFDGNEK